MSDLTPGQRAKWLAELDRDFKAHKKEGDEGNDRGQGRPRPEGQSKTVQESLPGPSAQPDREAGENLLLFGPDEVERAAVFLEGKISHGVNEDWLVAQLRDSIFHYDQSSPYWVVGQLIDYLVSQKPEGLDPNILAKDLPAAFRKLAQNLKWTASFEALSGGEKGFAGDWGSDAEKYAENYPEIIYQKSLEAPETSISEFQEFIAANKNVDIDEDFGLLLHDMLAFRFIDSGMKIGKLHKVLKDLEVFFKQRAGKK